MMTMVDDDDDDDNNNDDVDVIIIIWSLNYMIWLVVIVIIQTHIYIIHQTYILRLNI
jgi:predicted negative regulator of RcsB-dependent stress response